MARGRAEIQNTDVVHESGVDVYESAVTRAYFEDGWDDLEIEGNPELKEQIKQNIIEAEKQSERAYTRCANELQISIDVFKEKLQAKVEKMVEQSEFFVATPVSVLKTIIQEDGRWKSQFESLSSKGCLDPAYRAAAEMRMFGFNKIPDSEIQFNESILSGIRNQEVVENNKERRPICGYISDQENGVVYGSLSSYLNMVESYGDAFVKIKKGRALSKATVTFQDSLGSYKVAPPSCAAKPHFTSIDCQRVVGKSVAALTDLNKTRTGLGDWGGGFVEAQYHGGLTLDDIESINIAAEGDLDFEEVAEIERVIMEYNTQHTESPISLVIF